VPLLGIPAWQLDGFFLGATRGAAMRTAGVVSALGYVGMDIWLRPVLGNTGVWVAFLSMYVFRAAALAVFLPDLMRASEGPRRQPPQ
jgi:MATE family multidrug resistance protein